MAGSIPELLAVADKLDEEKSQNARKLSERIRNAIPRFEASEEVSEIILSSTYLFTTYLQRENKKRNENAAITDSRAKPHSPDQNQASHYTKDAPAARS